MERALDPMTPRVGDPTLPPDPEAEKGGDCAIDEMLFLQEKDLVAFFLSKLRVIPA